LQRIASVRTQAIVHMAAVVLAGLVLPLRINELFGPPSSEHPALWLLGVLLASIGAPFAVLSATAPLVQAWHARTVPVEAGRDRLGWVALAAIPSSLMLGVTTHLTTDVASAPFLWVGPLALYLLTFVIAFQAKPAISPTLTLLLQAAAVAACASLLPFRLT